MTWSKDQDGQQPPLRARLHRYQLTVAEFSLLTAMCEHCSDGSIIKAKRPRLAAYAKLSLKQVDRLIDGYADPRTGKRNPGLTERGILTELVPFSAGKRRTYIYRLNEDAMQLDPRMHPYLNQANQRLLPGILRPPKLAPPPKPASDAKHAARTVDTVSTVSGHRDHSEWTPCPGTVDTVSTDSKAFNSKHLDSKAGGWKTGELMDYRRLRQALNDSAPDNIPLREQWRWAARAAGLPWTYAVELVGRAEGCDLEAAFAADEQRPAGRA